VRPAAIVDALRQAGSHLTPTGDDLHYRTDAGVSISPYMDSIREHKPLLLAELRLRERIVSSAAAAAAAFDRQHYDQLWDTWRELNQEPH
jgi:hypothetical protein